MEVYKKKVILYSLPHLFNWRPMLSFLSVFHLGLFFLFLVKVQSNPSDYFVTCFYFTYLCLLTQVPFQTRSEI